MNPQVEGGDKNSPPPYGRLGQTYPRLLRRAATKNSNLHTGGTRNKTSALYGDVGCEKKIFLRNKKESSLLYVGSVKNPRLLTRAAKKILSSWYKSKYHCWSIRFSFVITVVEAFKELWNSTWVSKVQRISQF